MDKKQFMHDYYISHRDQIKESAREYYKKNKGEIQLNAKVYDDLHW